MHVRGGAEPSSLQSQWACDVLVVDATNVLGFARAQAHAALLTAAATAQTSTQPATPHTARLLRVGAQAGARAADATTLGASFAAWLEFLLRAAPPRLGAYAVFDAPRSAQLHPQPSEHPSAAAAGAVDCGEDWPAGPAPGPGPSSERQAAVDGYLRRRHRKRDARLQQQGRGQVPPASTGVVGGTALRGPQRPHHSHLQQHGQPGQAQPHLQSAVAEHMGCMALWAPAGLEADDMIGSLTAGLVRRVVKTACRDVRLLARSTC